MAVHVRRRSAALLLLSPWVLPVMVMALQVRPEGVDLRGDWQVKVADQPEANWRSVTLPTFFPQANLAAPQVTLRRTVPVPEVRDPAEPWLLVLGDLRSSTARLSVNGVVAGDVGAYETGERADFNGLETTTIAPGLVRAGPNELVLEVRSTTPAYSAISDRRLVLGPMRALGNWALRTQRVESFLRASPLLTFALLALLLAVLVPLSPTERERRLATRALWVVAGVGLYLWLQSGLGLPGVVPVRWRVFGLFLAVTASVTSVLEFVLDFFEAPARPWVPLNRVFAVLAVVVGEAAPFTRAYSLYSAWTFVLVGVMLVGTYRKVRRGVDSPTLVVSSALVVFAVAGVLDLATDMGLIHTPRLFALTLTQAPIIFGSVVVGAFVRISDANRTLTGSLARSNEELAHALADAREATRVKSEFLANVSHELRTPLNSIINIPEGLLEDFEGEGAAMRFVGEPQRTQRFLKTLHTSGLHLLGVVNQVLDFSKLEAGRMTVRAEPIEVGALLDDVLHTLQPLASKKGVTLRRVGEASAHFKADPVKVAQVLLNLGSNAVKFSPDGGVVTVEVRPDDGGLQFRVGDQGIGIAPEHRELIFEGFRQVEGGATRKFGGTGLGLAISRRLVALHGGALTLESTVGQGSTFIARFPLEPGTPIDVEPVRGGPQTQRPVVLVVDDEPLTQETLRLSLRHLEVDVVPVDDPRRVLEQARKLKPALVVLDVWMPRISGLTLLRQLRGSPDLEQLPVLVVSGYPSNREVVLSLGARWLDKPWDPDELAEVVRELAKLDPSGTQPLPQP